MKLLIVTQKVDINDDVLGFFHRWIEEFARHCEKVTVICLQKGEYKLPENVRVLSLGKENFTDFKNFRPYRLFQKLGYILNFYKHIWQERKNYDAVFVHMNSIYVVLGGLFWKILGNKIALWYTHKAVNLKLRLAEKLVDKIFTASKESFRLPSEKVEISGHGIDISKFESGKRKVESDKKDKFKIITAGRIAEVKNLHFLAEAADILKNKSFNFSVKIAGAPVLESDKIYFEKIKNLIQEKKLNDIIEFVGSIPNKDIGEFYQNGDLFVNFSDTGSIDKAILEAMACGLQILTSNEAFKNIVPSENFTAKNAEKIAQKIIYLFNINNESNNILRNFVVENHILDSLVNKIIKFYEKIGK